MKARTGKVIRVGDSGFHYKFTKGKYCYGDLMFLAMFEDVFFDYWKRRNFRPCVYLTFLENFPAMPVKYAQVFEKTFEVKQEWELYEDDANRQCLIRDGQSFILNPANMFEGHK